MLIDGGNVPARCMPNKASFVMDKNKIQALLHQTFHGEYSNKMVVCVTYFLDSKHYINAFSGANLDKNTDQCVVEWSPVINLPWNNQQESIKFRFIMLQRLLL